MSRWATGWLVAIALLAPFAAVAQEEEASGDPWTIRALEEVNGGLKAQWMDIRVEQLELLSKDKEKLKAGARLHRQLSRWVPRDPRRAADGDRLTYLIDRRGGSAGEEIHADVEAALDRAIGSWATEHCLEEVGIVKRPSTGEDVSIFDFSLGYGGFGNWQAADVVLAGWMPPSFFDAVAAEGGTSILALSVTFIFVDSDGEPTDIDGNGYYDIAASEIYFNDGFSWHTASGFDVETVALHEIGHSLGIGHIDAKKKEATMSPVYAGIHPELESRDRAAACSIWASWPY